MCTDAFDSARHGGALGYGSAQTLAWRARPAAELADAARELLNHAGWDDLKRRIEHVRFAVAGMLDSTP